MRFAITGSFDCTARLWDLTKSPITSQVLKGHSQTLLSVALSPDGHFALTGSMDRQVRLWHIEYIDKTLSLLDHLLILKLTKYEDLIISDSHALDCLLFIKKPELNPQITKLIEALFYRMSFLKPVCGHSKI